MTRLARARRQHRTSEGTGTGYTRVVEAIAADLPAGVDGIAMTGRGRRAA
jgi:hypothetical protein